MNYVTKPLLQPIHPLGTSKPQPQRETYRYISLPYDKRK